MIEEKSPRWSLDWWLWRISVTAFTVNVMMTASVACRYSLGVGTPAEPFGTLLWSSMGIYVAALAWYILRGFLRARKEPPGDEPR